MSIVFSSPQGLAVSRSADGSLSWSGLYDGVAIKCAIPSEDGERCIVLLDPDASSLSVFENLMCVDVAGTRVWTAKLPTSPDTFVDIASNAEGIGAKTWSGFNILLDAKTGQELRKIFVK